MDFARRQLEKYGWSNGKGLGKHENGISEAIKPKLKRSVTGIGHDAAAEFNEHWWSALYDKAAKNVEVEEKNGNTKKIKTVDGEDFTITNSTWRINKKRKNNDDNEYSEYFIKKAVLTNDGTKVENKSDSESDDGVKEKKDVFKMTDEELFKACGGRTAHKGARHGLRALGKLARIEQQEKMLLTETKYEGYSHAKKLKKKNEEVVEDTSLVDQEEKPKNKKKKKKKRCVSNDKDIVCDEDESEAVSLPESNEKTKNNKGNGDTRYMEDAEIDRNSTSRSIDDGLSLDDLGLENDDLDCNGIDEMSNRKKKRHIEEEWEVNNICPNVDNSDNVPKKKKKKKKHNEES